ncbi:MAG: PAS domain S-box protein, partial [Chloroflexi bacterium]|nr:PAS domain S-box protein [Chloroflexota bacterium]
MKRTLQKENPGAAITQEKSEINEKFRFLAAIVQAAEDAVITKDFDGTITSWNPAAERMFGYSEKEALGKPISIIGTPERINEFKEIIEKVKKGMPVERYETQRKRKDGTVV